MDEKAINDVVQTMEMLKYFNSLQHLPKEFYKLSDEEKAEVIKRFKRRNYDRPFDETK